MKLEDLIPKFIFHIFSFIKEAWFGNNDVVAIFKENKTTTTILFILMVVFLLYIDMFVQAIHQANLVKIEREKKQECVSTDLFKLEKAPAEQSVEDELKKFGF